MKTNRSAFGFSQEIEAEGTIGTIPSFPGFANIADINVQSYAAATKGHLPYSNFNFVSLRCFYPDAQVSLLGDGVALILNEAGTNKPFLTVLNQKTTCPNFRFLCDFAKATNLDSCLRLIPECSLPTLGNDVLVSERRDAFDYILSVNNMLYPIEQSIRQKHQLANDFLVTNPDTTIKELFLSCTTVLEGLLEVNSAWHSHRRQRECLTSDWERAAFLRCLQNNQDFSLVSLVAFSGNGTPLGFTINEEASNGYYIGHFGKTLPSCPGLSELLELETARLMQKRGCTHMNFQEDHANEGLRRMKLSWRPELFLKSYDVHSCSIKE